MNYAAIFPVLTVIIGGACVLLLVSTKTLRDSRDDQEKRIKQLEEERLRDKALIESQAAELKVWQRAVTGDAKLDEILARVTEHHEAAVASLAHLSATLDHIDSTMQSVATALEGTR